VRVRVLFLLISLLVAGKAVAVPPERTAPLPERIEWIIANPGDRAVRGLFLDTIEDASSLAELNSVRQRALPTLVDRELRQEGSRALAAIYRTARQLTLAEELYGQAYELSSGSPSGVDLESLFAQAQILLELGNLSQADKHARTVLNQTTDFSLKRRAYTLAARITYESGNSAQALEMLDTLASLANTDEFASDLVEVETLLLLRQILSISDDAGAAERIDDLLVRLFPDSIAAGIVTSESRRITLPGLPSALLLAALPDPESALSEARNPPSDVGLSARRDQPRLSAVQVGSFGDADNADHLTADLLRLGLAARTEAISREGSSLYQVVVDIPGGSTADAARILATLRENGFDGFLVY